MKREQDEKEQDNDAVMFQCLVSLFLLVSCCSKAIAELILAYAYISVNKEILLQRLVKLVGLTKDLRVTPPCPLLN
jgi:hypothetical protein